MANKNKRRSGQRRKKRHSSKTLQEDALRPKISLCLIARDEASLLDACLNSVQGLVDEIVVVDTGSVDETREVARCHGARVFGEEWTGNFSHHRNSSIDCVRSEWILALDCDEVLSAQHHADVLATLASGRADAYRLTTRNYSAQSNHSGWTACTSGLPEEEGQAGWYPTTKVRLWRAHPDVRFEGAVHELVEPSLKRIGVVVGDCEVPVHHFGYVAKTRRPDEYVEAGEQKLKAHPDDQAARYELAIAYRDAGKLDESLECIACVADAVEGEGSRVYEYLEDELVHLVHADVLNRLCRSDEALRKYEWTAARFPNSYQAFNNMGNIVERRGDRDRAISCYRHALEIAPENLTVSNNLERLLSTTPDRVQATVQLGKVSEETNPTLALCMIVRDEEERLPRCLDSVAGLFDEVVIVDTGSNDRTVAVAERYGAKVGHFEWCDDFAAARNAALELVSAEWIIWLDADDLLPQEHHEQIRQLTCAGSKVSYFFVLDDRGYEHVTCLQMRLFPNLPGVAFEMPIHEQVTPSLTRLGVDMVPTNIRVVHTGYTTPEVVREKKERYLGIMERWLLDHPEDYCVRSHVALTYHTSGRLIEAVKLYRAIIEDTTCLSDHNYIVYTTALLFLGRTYAKLGDLSQAEEFIGKAYQFDPDYILTKLSLAELYAKLNRWEKVLEFANQIRDGGEQVTFFPIDHEEIEYSAFFLVGQAYQNLGRVEDAAVAFQRAAATGVDRSSDALGSLSELYKNAGRRQEALKALDRALEITPHSAKHVFNKAALFLEEGDFDRAAKFFGQVLTITPEYSPALLNLGFVAKKQGEIDRAEGFYRRAIASNPEGIDARANLAHLFLEEGRLREAVDAFREVGDLEAGLLDVNLGLLAALSGLGDWDAKVAADALEPFVAKVTTDVANAIASPAVAETCADAFMALGAVIVQQNLMKCGEFAFQIAINLLEGPVPQGSGDAPPTLTAVAVGPRRCLGHLQYSGGNYWKAISHYEAILLADSRDGEAFHRLGDCYSKLGAEDAARLCYDRSQQVIQ